MNEDDTESLGLDEVARRFHDSEKALTDVHQKLKVLVAAEEMQVAAARGLDEASRATKELVDAVRRLVEEAKETQSTAHEVLKIGVGLVDGEALKEILEHGKGTAAAMLEGFEKIERLVGEIRERDERIAELDLELARRTGVLSKRQRKRLGLG